MLLGVSGCRGVLGAQVSDARLTKPSLLYDLAFLFALPTRMP